MCSFQSHKPQTDLDSSTPNRKLFLVSFLQLIPSGDPIVTHNLVGGAWEHLKNPTFPIMFHGVFGKDERESTSPSWFNPEEANEVVNWVALLTRDKPYVKEKDIGIISPYAKQVQKIKMLLGANGTQDVSLV